MGFDEAEYFPSYDRLAAVLVKLPLEMHERELDLLALEPQATAKMAAVVVASRGIMMSSWRSTLEMTPAAAELARTRIGPSNPARLG